MPLSYSFNGQSEGEVVKLIVRKNPRVLLMPGTKLILLFLAVSTILTFHNQINPAQILLLITLAIIIAFAIVFPAVIRYRSSVGLITNKRIIIVEKRGIWRQTISEVDLEKIFDIISAKEGFLNFLLNSGDLEFRTIGADNHSALKLTDISDPYSTQQEIKKIIDFKK